MCAGDLDHKEEGQEKIIVVSVDPERTGHQRTNGFLYYPQMLQTHVTTRKRLKPSLLPATLAESKLQIEIK